MVLRARVARSANSVRKLCTGRPSSVRPVVCLLTATGDRCACATTLVRRASAAFLSVSSNSIGASCWRMCHSHIIGEHAEEDVRTYPIGQPVMHRAYLEVDRLDAAECPFPAGEGFVAPYRGRVIERFDGQAGAHDVEAVGCGLGLDLGGLASEAEVGVGD